MAIDNSYLLGVFGGSYSSTSSSSLLAAARKKAQPTPPWDTSVKAAEPSALLRAALGGRKLINENTASIDLSGASSDYRKLFALYAGLESMTALVNRAAAKGVPASEQALVEKRFAAGLAEIGEWLQSSGPDGVRVVQGTSSSLSKSTAAVARDSAQGLTGPIHEGSADSVVKAFEGDVRFSMTFKRAGVTVPVAIDLADMGSTSRTLNNVLKHINGALEAAGVDTRIGREQIAQPPKTLQVGGRTVTLPDGPDRWALVLRGSPGETLTFSAPDSSDAVYVTQGAGVTGADQLLKFDASGTGQARLGETQWTEGRLSQTTLPEGVETVRATATAADGSVWMLADLSAGDANQPIKGERDVALMKFDSAGRLVMTRTLGAASEANGYALAVGADGRVAVAGSVTGGLVVTGETGTVSGKISGEDAAVADSFVTVFDAAGAELWTQRRGAKAADEATSVAFGPDGVVVVGGRSKSAMPGDSARGGWDAYVQTFDQSQAHKYAPVTAKAADVEQFGTAFDDGVQAVTVSGSDVYAASVENGRAVVRKYALDASGGLTLSATRDLGALGGNIAGIAVEVGRVVLAGTTRNGELGGATAVNAHAGGQDAFVLSLDASLSASASDQATYVGGAGDTTAADMKVLNGQVWITGQADRAIGAKDDVARQGYLSRIDLATGAVTQTRSWNGDGGQATPSSITVAAGGASVLDRLGLPTGEIAQTNSKQLTAATSLRVGDRFTVSIDGGRARTVTIEARDTLQTLARKIEQASNMRLKVTVASEGGYVTGKEADGETRATAGGFQRLSIMARGSNGGATLSSGEPGRDALSGLGLSPGYVGNTGEGQTKTFGLDLPASLSLSSADAVKASGERIQAALKAVRDAYRSLAPETKTAKAGQAPAYLTAQIANYQAALSRLAG